MSPERIFGRRLHIFAAFLVALCLNYLASAEGKTAPATADSPERAKTADLTATERWRTATVAPAGNVWRRTSPSVIPVQSSKRATGAWDGFADKVEAMDRAQPSSPWICDVVGAPGQMGPTYREQVPYNSFQYKGHGQVDYQFSRTAAGQYWLVKGTNPAYGGAIPAQNAMASIHFPDRQAFLAAVAALRSGGPAALDRILRPPLR